LEIVNWLSEKFTEEVEMSIGSCQKILVEDLGMFHVSAKFMPRLLTGDHKLWQFCIYENFQMSLQVMRPGFTVTTLKLNNNIRTGRVLLFLTPRKHDMCVGK
jgi:hypothetical protein